MTWFGWYSIAIIGARTLASIEMIGRPMRPMKHSTAIILVVLNAATIVAILTVGTGSLR